MIRCLLREDLRAEAAEALLHYGRGDFFLARFHGRKALGLASKLKDARFRRACMTFLNRLRGAEAKHRRTA